MKILEPSLILRGMLAIILFMHSVPGMFDGGVYAFGTLYLDAVGFAPVGLYLAWAIKLSHVVSAVLLMINRYILVACIPFALVLIGGIVMVHWQEGFYVVGGGRNGIEYNLLLLSVMGYLVMISRGQRNQ